MGLREKMNENPGMTTAVTAGITVLAIALIIWQMLPSPPPVPPNQAYYTEDDGKTYFVDDIEKVTPFKGPTGKDAVRAHVYDCPGGKFVGYLERFTPAAKKMLDEFYAKPENKGKQHDRRYEMEETQKLVKRPGTGNWILSRAPQAEEIIAVKCPDGNYARETFPKNK